ncbi:MAG: site-specific DNA-methyltransferase [Patulibacter sp.]
MRTMHAEIVVGDSLDVMRGMASGSVDAIVTSPPYADQRSYTPGEFGGRDANRRARATAQRARSAAPAEWVSWIEPYTAEMLRVLKPDGSLMLNLGVVIRDGEEHECVDDIVRQCRRQGWRLMQRMVWVKPNGQVPSHKAYLTQAHEFVFWLAPCLTPWRAYEQPAGSQASIEVRAPHSPSSAKRIQQMYSGRCTLTSKQGRTHKPHPDGARPTTVLTCSVGGAPNPNAHPARMPVRMASHLVSLCCPPGGLVLDPFSGDATTGVAAQRSGRRYLGIEINAGYARRSRQRLIDDAGLFGDVA